MSDLIETYFPLKYRLLFGLSVFSILAISDFRKNGWKSERLREYAFLLYCVFLAVAYGIINDMITSNISSEYFVVGKGIVPGEGFKLRVAWLAVKGSYWVGLIYGVALLVANNPYKHYARLSFFKLYKVPIISISLAVGASLTSYLYFQSHYEFFIVMMIHKAAYIGSLVGGLLGIGFVIRERIKRE